MRDAFDELWQRVGVKRAELISLLGLSVSLLLPECRKPVSGASKPRPSASMPILASRPHGSAAVPSSSGPTSAPRVPVDNDEPPEQPAAGKPQSGRWIVDELADVGPAGPASAAREGVVMITRQGGVLLGRLKGPLLARSKPAPTRIEPVSEPAESFSRVAAEPAILGDLAYFVLNGQLVRRRVSGDGAPEVLAPDAREGSRVRAAPARPGADPPLAAVAYLAPAKGRLVAKLWTEAAGVLELSPEGTSISSLALAQTPDGLMAVSLEGRSAMSPVHARRVRIQDGRVGLDSDVVVWVGGTAQQSTEISVLGAMGGDVHVFLPIERDITHFALARLHVEREPQMDADAWWRNYPNGIEPAPTATAWICGEPVVVYARPEDPSPQATQELCLSRITDQGLGAVEVVGHARRILKASIAPLAHGALIVYVGDKRTWAATLHCRAGR